MSPAVASPQPTVRPVTMANYTHPCTQTHVHIHVYTMYMNKKCETSLLSMYMCVYMMKNMLYMYRKRVYNVHVHCMCLSTCIYMFLNER